MSGPCPARWLGIGRSASWAGLGQARPLRGESAGGACAVSRPPRGPVSRGLEEESRAATAATEEAGGGQGAGPPGSEVGTREFLDSFSDVLRAPGRLWLLSRPRSGRVRCGGKQRSCGGWVCGDLNQQVCPPRSPTTQRRPSPTRGAQAPGGTPAAAEPRCGGGSERNLCPSEELAGVRGGRETRLGAGSELLGGRGEGSRCPPPPGLLESGDSPSGRGRAISEGESFPKGGGMPIGVPPSDSAAWIPCCSFQQPTVPASL